MTNYKSLQMHKENYVFLQAERKKGNDIDDYHLQRDCANDDNKTTNRLWHQSIYLHVCVKISFPVVNCFSMSLLWSFSYISHMFQTLALT